MKFLNPLTNEIFENIMMAKDAYCELIKPEDCFKCPLNSNNNGTHGDMLCDDFTEKYPIVAADIMVLEVIEDEKKTRENMDKPLGEWTLQEVQTYCRHMDCNECIFASGYLEGSICAMVGNPTTWVLSGESYFTQEEIEDAKMLKTLYRLNNNAILFRDDKHNLWCEYEDGKFSLPIKLFSSIPINKSVCLKEILGEETDCK